MAEGDNINPTPELQPGDVKVLVIGKSGCGKTRFIRQFYNRHSPSEISFRNGTMVYPCRFRFEDQFRTVSIYEISADDITFAEQQISEHSDADCFILMYAIDDPSSFVMLNEFSAASILHEKLLRPVLVLGCKRDLRDRYVAENPALNNHPFVSRGKGENFLQYTNVKLFAECSTLDMWTK